MLFFFNAFLNKFAKILFELNASDPPLKIAQLPDFKQREQHQQLHLVYSHKLFLLHQSSRYFL